ncbi:hypothetical protein R5R35_002769 [Gryllus longicercus]|uniref:Uncharacterized protein n=1 Tax=Gryllus longicercus TaxID=2509291 RepID=A0AAN9VXR1_9ORTH
MKRMFKLGSTKADGSGGSSESVCSNGNGGVKIKSMRFRTGSEMDSDAEMQSESLIPPREADAWRLSDDEEDFHDVELRLHDEDDRSNSFSATCDPEHPEVRRRSNKKKKKSVWEKISCHGNRRDSKTVNCCSVS